jgi:hypothetical protein
VDLFGHFGNLLLRLAVIGLFHWLWIRLLGVCLKVFGRDFLTLNCPDMIAANLVAIHLGFFIFPRNL